MFNPTRDQARALFFDTWQCYAGDEPLTGLQTLVLDIILRHPEYHALLDDLARNRERDFTPEAGQMNPFLHLSLHVAIAEQLSIDQPPGIRAEYERLVRRHGDAHAAEHVLLECLGETLWQAQRTGSAPDAEGYLDCIRRSGARS